MREQKQIAPDRKSAQQVRGSFRAPTGYVYFARVGADGPIKIGFAKDPRDRMRALQTALWADITILALYPGTKETELKFHLKFGDYGIRGEWFWPSRALMEFINSLPSHAVPKPLSRAARKQEYRDQMTMEDRQ